MLTNAGHLLTRSDRQVEAHMNDVEGYIDELIRKGSNLDYRGEFAPGHTISVTREQKNMTHSELMNLRRRNVKLKPIASVKDDKGNTLWIFPDVVQDAFDSGYVCNECWEWQEVPNTPKCNWLHKTPHADGCGNRPY